MAEESYNNDSQEHILELVLPFLPARDVFHVTLVSRHFASKNNDLTIGRLLYERTIRLFPKVDSILPNNNNDDYNGGEKEMSWQLPPKFAVPSKDHQGGQIIQDPRDNKAHFDSLSYKEKAISIIAYRNAFKKFYDSLPKPRIVEWLLGEEDAEELDRRIWLHFAQELVISQEPLLSNHQHQQNHPEASSSSIPLNFSEIDNNDENKRQDPILIVIYCVCRLYGMYLFTLTQRIQDDIRHQEATQPCLVARMLASIAALTIFLVFFLVILQHG